MSREFSKCCMRGRKLSRWITKQWDKLKRQLVLKLDSAINELISKRVVTTIELKDSDVHKMPRRKTVINILMVSIACGFCCTLILIFYFGWWFSSWFTCLMLALIKESDDSGVLDQVNLLLDHLPNHLPCSDKSNQRPKPAQLPDHPLQTDAVKHKT